MSWDYRVIYHDTEEGGPDHYWYALHEVYYDDNGRPSSWTQDAVGFVADNDEGAQGIVQSLETALADAQNRPVLLMSELNKSRSSEEE